MLNEIKQGNIVFQADKERTARYYSSLKDMDIKCKDKGVINYVKNIPSFSAELKEFFSSLGIDPKKEGMIASINKAKDGDKIMYNGIYHFIGKASAENLNKVFEISEVTFSLTHDLSNVPEDFPDPILQLEFLTAFDWLLDESFEQTKKKKKKWFAK